MYKLFKKIVLVGVCLFVYSGYSDFVIIMPDTTESNSHVLLREYRKIVYEGVNTRVFWKGGKDRNTLFRKDRVRETLPNPNLNTTDINTLKSQLSFYNRIVQKYPSPSVQRHCNPIIEILTGKLNSMEFNEKERNKLKSTSSKITIGGITYYVLSLTRNTKSENYFNLQHVDGVSQIDARRLTAEEKDRLIKLNPKIDFVGDFVFFSPQFKLKDREGIQLSIDHTGGEKQIIWSSLTKNDKSKAASKIGNITELLDRAFINPKIVGTDGKDITISHKAGTCHLKITQEESQKREILDFEPDLKEIGDKILLAPEIKKITPISIDVSSGTEIVTIIKKNLSESEKNFFSRQLKGFSLEDPFFGEITGREEYGCFQYSNMIAPDGRVLSKILIVSPSPSSGTSCLIRTQEGEFEYKIEDLLKMNGIRSFDKVKLSSWNTK